MTNEQWLEGEKERLRNINGLDPVEELLTQIGVCQASNFEAVQRMNKAFEHCGILVSLCLRLADTLEEIQPRFASGLMDRAILTMEDRDLITELRKHVQ